MIKIGISEDQALFRKGIVALISSLKGVEVTEEAENGKEYSMLMKRLLNVRKSSQILQFWT